MYLTLIPIYSGALRSAALLWHGLQHELQGHGVEQKVLHRLGVDQVDGAIPEQHTEHESASQKAQKEHKMVYKRRRAI